jgi:hypothetical protein
MSFHTASIVGVGSSAPEIYALIPWVAPELCAALNRALGLEEDYPYTAPIDSLASFGTFSGTLSDVPASTGVFGDDETDLIGQNAFCYKTNAGGIWYGFVYVLAER